MSVMSHLPVSDGAHLCPGTGQPEAEGTHTEGQPALTGQVGVLDGTPRQKEKMRRTSPPPSLKSRSTPGPSREPRSEDPFLHRTGPPRCPCPLPREHPVPQSDSGRAAACVSNAWVFIRLDSGTLHLTVSPETFIAVLSTSSIF